MSVTEAQQRLINAFAPVEPERILLAAAAGRVLAEDVSSPMELPPFPNSTVDGFAARSEDLQSTSREKPVQLSVVGDIAAGQVADIRLNAGQAARIMTGAPLPAGADSVVPVEDTDFHHRQQNIPAPEKVNIFRPLKSGENIRPRGQDVRTGQKVLLAGARLRPQEAGFLAMIGMSQVTVFRRPRVALVSTGDELIPAGEALKPGKIYDSNTTLLAALIDHSGCEPVILGIAPDQAEAVKELFDKALDSRVDFILSSAGVSVGAHDYVRAVVESHGSLDFWRVNIRPGKPLAFGRYHNLPFIGLPGNPVSAFACFEVFVRPVLMKLSGVKSWNHPALPVKLTEAIQSDGRESYLRGVVTNDQGTWMARLTGHQGSGNLFSLVQANAFLIVPPGVKSLPVGAEVDAWLFDWSPPG